MITEFGEKLANVEYKDRYSVYALIFNKEGDIAVTYVKGKDIYFLPGGGVEAGETQEQCVKRECREEIGKEIEVLDYFLRTIMYEKNERLDTYHKIIGDFYFAKIEGNAINAMEEEHELYWLPPEHAIEVLVLENQAWAVKKALGVRK